MKLKIKKFIYLINDLSNVLLMKSRGEAEDKVKKLRFALIAITALLVLSVIFNIYLIYKK